MEENPFILPHFPDTGPFPLRLSQKQETRYVPP
jgi:hypothetical protein